MPDWLYVAMFAHWLPVAVGVWIERSRESCKQTAVSSKPDKYVVGKVRNGGVKPPPKSARPSLTPSPANSPGPIDATALGDTERWYPLVFDSRDL